MIESIQVTGKPEDEAIASALKQLGLERDAVSVEIIERAKSGFLGLGASPAVVKVSYEKVESQQEKVESFIRGLLQHMGAEADITITEREKGLNVCLSGDNMGVIIGRRGETLDAIQHLTNYAVNHACDERIRVSVDAEAYREKREESLRRYAQKKAQQVLKARRRTTLEPMNAYERHVIHATLQEVDNITTYSTGTEPNRRVVIEYER